MMENVLKELVIPTSTPHMEHPLISISSLLSLSMCVPRSSTEMETHKNHEVNHSFTNQYKLVVGWGDYSITYIAISQIILLKLIVSPPYFEYRNITK